MPNCKVEDLAVECIYLEKELLEKYKTLSQATSCESKKKIVSDINRLLKTLASNESEIEETTHLCTNQ